MLPLSCSLYFPMGAKLPIATNSSLPQTSTPSLPSLTSHARSLYTTFLPNSNPLPGCTPDELADRISYTNSVSQDSINFIKNQQENLELRKQNAALHQQLEDSRAEVQIERQAKEEALKKAQELEGKNAECQGLREKVTFLEESLTKAKEKLEELAELRAEIDKSFPRDPDKRRQILRTPIRNLEDSLRQQERISRAKADQIKRKQEKELLLQEPSSSQLKKIKINIK